jgi:methyl-accepting chemotaxis protein
MTQMEQVTQQAAANAEESAAASESMSSQSDTMTQVVQQLVAMVGGAR